MWLFLKSSIHADCHGCICGLHCPESSTAGVMIRCLEEAGVLCGTTQGLCAPEREEANKKKRRWEPATKKKCMTKDSRRASGVWIKHPLVQASSRRRRLLLFYWRSSTVDFPELDRVVMALFAFNYLITSYKLLWRELTSISLVKSGISEREIQSHGSCCKCSLYTLFIAFNLKKNNKKNKITKNHESKIQKKRFPFF